MKKARNVAWMVARLRSAGHRVTEVHAEFWVIEPGAGPQPKVVRTERYVERDLAQASLNLGGPVAEPETVVEERVIQPRVRVKDLGPVKELEWFPIDKRGNYS